MAKTIKVRWVITLLAKGFFRYCCYAKRREVGAWLTLRWASWKKRRSVIVGKAFTAGRPRHNTVRLKCYRDGELEAVLYADTFRMAELIGELWKRKTTRRTYEITDWRFGKTRVVSSRHS